jgi:hypothetical protein
MVYKYVTAFFLVSVLILIQNTDSFAGHEGPVTPYGDFCPRCSEYGNCKSNMSHDEAKEALISYYQKKGLGVELEKKRGRFIRVKVKDRNKVVDIIIFDRRSGRIRSIY